MSVCVYVQFPYSPRTCVCFLQVLRFPPPFKFLYYIYSPVGALDQGTGLELGLVPGCCTTVAQFSSTMGKMQRTMLHIVQYVVK